MSGNQGSSAALRNAVAPSAPTLAAALDGPLASNATSLLGMHLLNDSAPKLEDLTAAAAHPDSDVKLKQAELYWSAHKPSLTAPPVHPVSPSAETAIADRLEQGAAQYIVARNLAYGVTVGFFILVFCLVASDRWPTQVKGTVSTTAGASADPMSGYRDILFNLMGVIGTGWAGIISFYFGSSVGSRQQSQTLQAISSRITTPPPG